MGNLIAGIILFLLGAISFKFHTKEPNSAIGYRTMLAKKNKDTWNTAQKACGISLVIVGILNICFFIFVNETRKFDTTVMMNGFLLCTVVLSFVIDEVYLNRIFDAEGKRKIGKK